jgi:hypothetical protein
MLKATLFFGLMTLCGVMNLQANEQETSSKSSLVVRLNEEGEKDTQSTDLATNEEATTDSEKSDTSLAACCGKKNKKHMMLACKDCK